MVTIKDYGQIFSGATPKGNIPEYWDGNIAWVTPKDISNLTSKYIGDTPRKITQTGFNNCSAVMLPAGSVLLSSRAPIGYVAINTIPMATNQGFKSIVTGPKLNSDFLYWWLKAHRQKLENLGNGATFKEISKSVLEKVQIPLPPLEEQKRIAAILDQADALRRLRQRAIDRLNTLGQAIFYEMFGGKFLQKHYHRLGDFIEDFRYGTSNKSDEEGYPTLRIPNVVDGKIEISDLKKVPITDAELNRLRLKAGDLLFVRTNGNPDYVGRSAIFDPEITTDIGLDKNNWIYASYLIRGRLNNNKLHPVFLQSFLSTAQGRRSLKERCKTSAGQFNINIDGLSSIPIIVPEFDKQLTFVQLIKKINIQIKVYQISMNRFDALFLGLQHRAFRGEL